MLHLSAQNLTIARGGRLLVHGLSLQLWRGEATWLHGVNGGGKTSVLRALAGLSQPVQGDISRHAPIRWMGHHLGLKDDLTALESVLFLGSLNAPRGNEGAARDALRDIGLSACMHLPIRKLSQGQRKRCALAALLMAPAETIWILDEPFDSLDVQAVEQLLTMMNRHRQAGGSILFSSHIDVRVPDAQGLALETCALRGVVTS